MKSIIKRCLFVLSMVLCTLLILPNESFAAEKKTIITANLTDAFKGATDIKDFGKDLYRIDFDGEEPAKLFSIDSSVLKNWKKTGKLAAAKVDTKGMLDVQGWTYYDDELLTKGNTFFVKVPVDPKDYEGYYEEEIPKYYCMALKYNSKKKTVKTVTAFNDMPYFFEYVGMFRDGGVLVGSEDGAGSAILIVDSEGDELYYNNRPGKYVKLFPGRDTDYVYYAVDEDYAQEETKLVRYDSKGRLTVIEEKMPDWEYRLSSQYNSIYCKKYDQNNELEQIVVFSAEDDKIYTVKKAVGFDGYTFEGITAAIHGGQVVAKYSKGEEYMVRVVDIRNDSFVGKQYKEISLCKNGKSYFVKNAADKEGYMDLKGKELGFFDSAADFYGKYAPVVKNGYMYLVNAKMKTASEKVKVSADADVSSVGEELFVLTAGKKVELITLK
ncbi:MAG: hypothetical protein MJ131_04765 [Lachnospiraceae bacterium]|nr:hypothetical protein [Lachnospiraceae bacterium]